MRHGIPAFAAVLAASAILIHNLPAMHAEDRTRQSSTGQMSTAPTLKVYSRETVVDVTVTNAKGDPVHGLTRDDFTVMEDGKKQPIRSFEEFGVQVVPPPPKLPPNVYTNLQPPAAGGATNVLWLDFTNAAPVLAVDCCSTGMGDSTLGSFPAATQQWARLTWHVRWGVRDVPSNMPRNI